jgi:HlyD family secretion protein
MRWRANWRLIGPLIAAAVILVGATAYWIAHHSSPTHYVTAAVTRGDVVTTITASGTVNPVVTVEVGTYVSGTIEVLNCDYNTRVRKGQLCAKIDPRPYAVVVLQDQADLAAAKAQLIKDQAGLVYAKASHERADRLWKAGAISRDAVDSALDAYNQALALTGLDAAQIALKAAQLKAAQINLDYTNIVSPVDGTVVSRNVNVGQTVAASFQTPTLFLIATDLTKMQVDTNVSESDIGGAVEGAGASFTVDAFPDRTFHGRVSQVRQAPISVQNVITYDVVVTVANPNLLLKPGMTATVKIAKTQAKNVLRVPSQALRFTPSAKRGAAKTASDGQRVVWLERDGELVLILVTVGLGDGTFTEIKAGDLKPGDRVVTSESTTGREDKPQPAPTSTLHI